VVEGIFRPENSSTETPPMHDSKVRSRLKAQLTKFCTELCAGLSKPLAKFVRRCCTAFHSCPRQHFVETGQLISEDIAVSFRR